MHIGGDEACHRSGIAGVLVCAAGSEERYSDIILERVRKAGHFQGAGNGADIDIAGRVAFPRAAYGKSRPVRLLLCSQRALTDE